MNATEFSGFFHMLYFYFKNGTFYTFLKNLSLLSCSLIVIHKKKKKEHLCTIPLTLK